MTPLEPSDLTALVPFLAALGGGEIASIAARLDRRPMRAGDTIVHEGALGESLFAIARGRVRVVRARNAGAKDAQELGAGEVFGEISLFARAPRLATVVAATDGELVEIERAQLDAAAGRDPGFAEALARFRRERLWAAVSRSNTLFGLLPADRQRMLAQLVRVEAHAAGELLIEQGRPSAGFFVLLRGRCEVFHTSLDGREEHYPPMGEGDFFGELSILQNGPGTATVRAATACVLLLLPREWFDELLLGEPAVRETIYAVAGRRAGRTQELLAVHELDRHFV